MTAQIQSFNLVGQAAWDALQRWARVPDESAVATDEIETGVRVALIERGFDSVSVSVDRNGSAVQVSVSGQMLGAGNVSSATVDFIIGDEFEAI